MIGPATADKSSGPLRARKRGFQLRFSGFQLRFLDFRIRCIRSIRSMHPMHPMHPVHPMHPMHPMLQASRLDNDDDQASRLVYLLRHPGYVESFRLPSGLGPIFRKVRPSNLAGT